LTLAVALFLFVSMSATAADTGAVANGNWSSATTWTNGVPGALDNAYVGSNYPAGAAANATVTLSQNSSTGNLYLGEGAGNSGTLDLGGQTLTASRLYLGDSGGTGSIQRTGGGTFSAGGVYQNSGNFSFAPGDATSYLQVSNGAAATTATTGNVTNNAEVDSGCSLTLEANLGLASPSAGNLSHFDIRGNLNSNGHAISAAFTYVGVNGGPVTIANRGPIGGGYLEVSSKYTPALTTFNLTPADSSTSLDLYGVNTFLAAGVSTSRLSLGSNGSSPPVFASATTTSINNVTYQLGVSSGCTLTLGADLNLNYSLPGQLSLSGTINANGHAITSSVVDIYGSATFQNDGVVTVGSWGQSTGSQIRLNQPGDALGNLFLTGNSTLTVGDAAGQMTGLTIGNPTTSDLSIAAGSDLVLEVNGLASGWVLRWANLSGGDHIADLQNLISGGEIAFSYLNGGVYNLTSDGTYTYVAVPEPSTLLLTAAAAGGLAAIRRRRTNQIRKRDISRQCS
jgi:hypothetical protein